MRNVENKISNILNGLPFIKKMIKRTYQIGWYLISKKIKSEGDIQRISPDDGMEYFFGYYDKSPWDATDRYMLCLRAENTYNEVAPKEPAEIILIDTKDSNSFKVLGTTHSWNVQQGCMLQWLGPDFKERVIYNDFRNNQYCSVILNIKTREEKVIPMPVYSVSQDGKFALSLDFSRLHRLRPGYGYANLPDFTKDEKCPDQTCIWKVDLEDLNITPVLKYTDFLQFETREEMIDAEHKVNHIMLNPTGDRFMVLHRWISNNKKYTRLVTVNIDGTDMYNLNDDNMTSHCCWKDDHKILAFAHKNNSGNGYYLMKDKTHKYKRMWPELQTDGHPSYSPDGSMVITDTYPNRSRVATVYLIERENVKKIARVFAPFKYDNDVRCDLHPRWNHNGNSICFDATFEGKRNLYITNMVKD